MISNVMLIDDNKIDLFVCQKIIEKYNPNIKTRNFTSGVSAINYLKLCQKKTKPKTIVQPDLILLDINMPQMDGFQFIEELKKQNLSLEKFPRIYMLSSSLYHEDISKAENEIHCSGYIDKPLTVDKFSKICCTKNKRNANRTSSLILF